MYWARETQTSDAGQIHYSSHQSLRLRERPLISAVQPQPPPQFNWNGEQSEEGAKGRPRNLKELPLPMELKKAIRQVQQMTVPVISNWQSWKISKSKTIKRFLEESREVLVYVAPWRRTLHKIVGHFGGGVQSYFLFLRFLVVLNFLSFLLIAGFVLAPSIVFQSSHGNSETPNSISKTSLRTIDGYDCLDSNNIG